jgi:hypothetical protein
MSENKRLFSRVNFVVQAEVVWNDQVFQGELHNISLKGALLNFPGDCPLKLNEDCLLRFNLADSDIRLEFKAQLVHAHEGDYGFTFISEDLDTMIHLRNLLELNLGDDVQILNELPFMIRK